MKSQRPINLDLSTFSYPPMAIASILHRISGILIFLFLPFILYLLDLSLKSEYSFASIEDILSNSFLKLILWVFSSAAAYHALAGFRHIFMDFGFGEELQTARITSFLTIGIGIIMIIILGIWIW